jgi:hypothetical protein
MARYDVAHSCGHTAQHQIYGTNAHGEREHKAKQLGERPCSDCSRAAKAEQRHTVAGAYVDLDQMPPLAGSDKQVAWATQLRIDGLTEIILEIVEPDGGVPRLARSVWIGHTGPMDGAQLQRIPLDDRGTAIDLLVTAALTHRDARWWIDNRGRITWATIDGLTRPQRAALNALCGARQ